MGIKATSYSTSVQISKGNGRTFGNETSESWFLEGGFFVEHLKIFFFFLIFKMIIELGTFRKVNSVNQNKVTIPIP